MEREGSLARKSAILGPVITVVDQFQSGDREGAMGIMRKFLDGVGENILEAGYQRWREGFKPEIAQIIADLIQEDPNKEKNLRGRYLDSALIYLERLGQVKEKPSSDQ